MLSPTAEGGTDPGARATASTTTLVPTLVPPHQTHALHATVCQSGRLSVPYRHGERESGQQLRLGVQHDEAGDQQGGRGVEQVEQEDEVLCGQRTDRGYTYGISGEGEEDGRCASIDEGEAGKARGTDPKQPAHCRLARRPPVGCVPPPPTCGAGAPSSSPLHFVVPHLPLAAGSHGLHGLRAAGAAAGIDLG